jgi:hypothetical protein
MWMFDQKGKKLIQGQENPKFYLCQRFFTTEAYRTYSKLPIKEVVSVDYLLFPYSERILFDEDSANEYTPAKEEQLLRVRFIEKNIQFIPEEVIDFEFLGFDLAEKSEISALTNCGGFDETFTYKDLNAFGLIPDFPSARRIQADLAMNNPNEEHADCLLFAIWRKN